MEMELLSVAKFCNSQYPISTVIRCFLILLPSMLGSLLNTNKDEYEWPKQPKRPNGPNCPNGLQHTPNPSKRWLNRIEVGRVKFLFWLNAKFFKTKQFITTELNSICWYIYYLYRCTAWFQMCGYKIQIVSWRNSKISCVSIIIISHIHSFYLPHHLQFCNPFISKIATCLCVTFVGGETGSGKRHVFNLPLCDVEKSWMNGQVLETDT